MGYNLLINRVYWSYNLVTNHLLSSWDIQVAIFMIFMQIHVTCSNFHHPTGLDKPNSWMSACGVVFHKPKSFGVIAGCGFSLVKTDAARKMPRANKKRSSSFRCVSQKNGETNVQLAETQLWNATFLNTFWSHFDASGVDLSWPAPFQQKHQKNCACLGLGLKFLFI